MIYQHERGSVRVASMNLDWLLIRNDAQSVVKYVTLESVTQCKGIFLSTFPALS